MSIRNDAVRDKAAHAISKWIKILKEEGVLHGELGYYDELEELITNEFKEEKQND